MVLDQRKASWSRSRLPGSVCDRVPLHNLTRVTAVQDRFANHWRSPTPKTVIVNADASFL
eukprot:scaffold204338_cov17-Prasinocladus_malaysianus.AAC.1